MPIIIKCRECGGTDTRLRLVLVAPGGLRTARGEVAIDYTCAAPTCHGKTYRDVDKVDVRLGS